jgi:hypothetical protein
MQNMATPQEPSLEKVYGCKRCQTQVAKEIDRSTISKYNGRHGAGWLFHIVENVNPAPPIEMNMTTGLHTVQEVSCSRCTDIIGWKYIKAPNEKEQYKVGRYLLEAELLCDVVVEERGNARL